MLSGMALPFLHPAQEIHHIFGIDAPTGGQTPSEADSYEVSVNKL